MDQNQVSANQVNQGSDPREVFRKAEEKKSKLPLISVVLSGITLFLTIIILIVVIMSTFMRPTMGGMTRDRSMPQNLDSAPFGQQQDDRGGNAQRDNNNDE